MNGMRYDHFGHPPRPKFSPWVYIPALGLLSLAFAMWWADTNHAATSRANGLAKQQMEQRTGQLIGP
jgi:preprotein translocase subunit SecY